jgi:hypothetical protein
MIWQQRHELLGGRGRQACQHVLQMSRGLYRLADAPPLGNPNLVTVALKVPHGVICLISALAYHDLTT